MDKVLLCSFDPMLKKGLQGPLSDAGFNMDFVDYPAEAIRLIMKKSYKAVILDTGGIGMDPYDAAIIIKNLSNEMKVVILGANGSGLDIYSLSKPVDTGRLKEILRKKNKIAQMNPGKEESMTPKEIILKAYNVGKPERVPVTLFGAGMWSIKAWGTSFEELSKDPGKMSRMLVDMSEKLECDMVYAGSGYNNFHASALGGKIKFREMGAPDLENHLINSEEDLARLNISEIDKDETINVVKEALRATRKAIGDKYVVTMTAWGPFTLGARLLGEELMMKATFKKPAFVDRIVSFATDLLIHLYEPLVNDKTLEVISLADPTASGDLISKKQFEKFAVPYLKKFTDWARSKGAHTLLHICGNTSDRLELFPLTGASCVSLDHKTDISKAKEVLGGKMCFGGNVDPVSMMLNGTPEKVESSCREIIEKAGRDGAFVLMPGCDIPPTVPYENIQTFIRTARDWRY